MKNKYRLTSTVYDRESENDKIDPLKIYFISVEGNATEKEYFDGISKHRLKLGINAKVNVEVLRKTVAMSDYQNTEDYKKHAELVLFGDIENMGKTLFLNV